MGTLERTWSLFKQSFNVLSADAEIVLFPVMSAVSAIVLAAGFFYPLFRSGLFKGLDPENLRWEIYAILFIWYIIILAAITSAVKGVFTVVLYRYATTGAIPAGFSAREIDSTFGERKRNVWDITV